MTDVCFHAGPRSHHTAYTRPVLVGYHGRVPLIEVKTFDAMCPPCGEVLRRKNRDDDDGMDAAEAHEQRELRTSYDDDGGSSEPCSGAPSRLHGNDFRSEIDLHACKWFHTLFLKKVVPGESIRRRSFNVPPFTVPSPIDTRRA